ncbi:MAG: hypothetical protein OXT09_29460, partial [Myxococcales bacterium]|nr:hypothetical protein [Myxococcales bacterium]
PSNPAAQGTATPTTVSECSTRPDVPAVAIAIFDAATGLPLAGTDAIDATVVEGTVVELGEALPADLQSPVSWDDLEPRSQWRWLRVQRPGATDVLLAHRIPEVDPFISAGQPVHVAFRYFAGAETPQHAQLTVTSGDQVRLVYQDAGGLAESLEGFGMVRGALLCSTATPCGVVGERTLHVTAPSGDEVELLPGETTQLGDWSTRLFRGNSTEEHGGCADWVGDWIQLAMWRPST